jgi:hypothetical protein
MIVARCTATWREVGEVVPGVGPKRVFAGWAAILRPDASEATRGWPDGELRGHEVLKRSLAGGVISTQTIASAPHSGQRVSERPVMDS